MNGIVQDAGGGLVTILVDRDTMHYPAVGERVTVHTYDPLNTVNTGRTWTTWHADQARKQGLTINEYLDREEAARRGETP